MIKHIFLLLISFLCTVSLLAEGWESQPIPNPEQKISSYVTDGTGTLNEEQFNSLVSKLSDFDKETSTQVVVYMISTLGGESLEETSHEIAEKNGIGQKGKNNGVLLFIAKQDRKLRIEVGYGLEGVLPDALCSQIIRKEITPYFKQGKYYEGINAGVDAIIASTKGEYTQEKRTEKQEDFGVGCCGMPILVLVIFFFFGFFFIMSIFRRIFGWGRGSRSSWWNSGSWSSGSSSSWSSGSSGGFSGGGGSFGGGGASGSW